VFINILVNAAQAMKNRGVIAIKTYKKDNFVCIEISDTGSGISKENITKIFDAFFTTKEPGKGTGLGLGISAEIVKKHGGTIDVQSVLGQGTTFTISLPEVNALSGESNKKEV
jgi:signal transduction histidine kinase